MSASSPSSPSSTGIILAGGSSTRMGRDKRQLPWNETTMLEHVVNVVASVCDEVIVVVADPATPSIPAGARPVADSVAGAGPIAGLHAGLAAARAPHCFVCSCDLPLLRPSLVRFLLDELHSGVADAVVPRTQHGTQPLCAAWSTRLVDHIAGRIAAAEHSLRALVDSLAHVRFIDEPELRRVDPQLLSLTNLNTEPEYLDVVRRFSGAAGSDDCDTRSTIE